MFDTFQDLPVHALVVHATVVLVPLAAIMVALAAVYPRFRAWAGPLPLIGAVVAVILTPVSTLSGEEFEKRLGYTKESCVGIYDAIEEHEELADWLIYLVIVMALLALVGYLVHRRGTPSTAVVTTVAILTVLSSATVAVQVARIGHAGATATWNSQC